MHETAAVGPQEEEDEWRPFHRVLEDGEVLPKGQVVKCSCVASRECGGTRADKRPDLWWDIGADSGKDQPRWARMTSWEAQAVGQPMVDRD